MFCKGEYFLRTPIKVTGILRFPLHVFFNRKVEPPVWKIYIIVIRWPHRPGFKMSNLPKNTCNIKWKYTPATSMRSRILSKLIFASCVWYSDLACYGYCVLIKDICRRLPLQLQCGYQGQQGDVSQSLRGNYKTRFWGGQYWGICAI